MNNFFVDFNKNEIILNNGNKIQLYSPEGFKIISDVWLRVGWDQKQMYSFSWLGRPLIQTADDTLRIQEVIYSLKPDIILETGIAHGGSLIFYASLCKAMDCGKVIGVDIEIRPHNRVAIENHKLFDLITLIEGNSISLEIFNKVQKLINKEDKVIVILDSAHTYDHVLNELKLYSKFVSVGSFIVATDGSQEYLNETPRAQKEYSECLTWNKNNPKKAAEDFVKENNNFKIIEPEFPFNEGNINFRVTHWPSAFIKRIA